MKKITLLIAFLFAVVSQSYAQFTESFEAAALPATWTVINGGDTNTWLAIDLSASTTISGHTGTHVAGIVYTTPTAHDDYLITPSITVASGVNDRFSFWARSRDPLYQETVDLLVSTTTATVPAFTVALDTDIAPTSGAGFFKYTYDLSDYVGQTIYLAFHSTTADLFVFDIDDVVSDAQPFCSEPNPAAAGITETTVNISWPAVAGSVNYEYVLDNSAADPVGAGTSTTATSYSNALLSNSTTYYFHIRNNCDVAGMSIWSTISFSTLAPFTGCLNADNFGQWPATTFVPSTCDGITVGTITGAGYAGEYSVVTVQAGQTYKFASSVATDYITISTDDGVTGAAYGLTPLTWVSTVDGDIRFYTHLDVDCGELDVSRTRSVVCGIPACTIQTVTFAKVSNCPDNTFNVTANVTNFGSATSITVTDNQSSTPQVVLASAPGVVSFGPFANGTSVILTTTNTDSPTCVISSTAQTQVACPPANDNFANAEAITCGSQYTGNTVAATLDEANPTQIYGVDLDAPNVWYSYTGTGTPESVTLSLCASLYDTSVAVFTGTSGALTMIAGNDDNTVCGAFSTRSQVTFTSDGTTTYHIVVEGYNFLSTGAYTMDVSCGAVTPPAVTNQNCGTALGILVDGNNVNSDNSFGDLSATQTSCDLFGPIQDVWFSFVAPASGTVDVQLTNGFMTSGNFTVYSGACGSLTETTAACNSDIATSATESLTGLAGGTTYYIQVWSNAAEQGSFSLRLSDPNMATTAFDSSNFKAYPNPVKNVLNLSYDKNISNVSVFNLVGQEVITKTVDATQSQIDMSHLAVGTYMVKVTADNQVKTIKVIKE